MPDQQFQEGGSGGFAAIAPLLQSMDLFPGLQVSTCLWGVKLHMGCGQMQPGKRSVSQNPSLVNQ